FSRFLMYRCQKIGQFLFGFQSELFPEVEAVILDTTLGEAEQSGNLCVFEPDTGKQAHLRLLWGQLWELLGKQTAKVIAETAEEFGLGSKLRGGEGKLALLVLRDFVILFQGEPQDFFIFFGYY